LDTIRENNYNLSVIRYADVFVDEESIDIAEIWRELKKLASEREITDESIRQLLQELGYE